MTGIASLADYQSEAEAEAEARCITF